MSDRTGTRKKNAERCRYIRALMRLKEVLLSIPGLREQL